MHLSDATPGGYCKEYTKGKRPIGVMLEDSWFLKWGGDVTEPESADLNSFFFLG